MSATNDSVNANNSALGYGDVDTTGENAYWLDNHAKTGYYNKDYNYDIDYQSAYATGYEGRSRYDNNTRFEDVETDSETSWNQKKGDSKMTWSDARHAVNDAWNRVSK